MKTTVSTGKTLDAAVNNGLAELGLTREQAEVKVLQEGGFLKSFKVEVTEKPSQTQKIQNFLAEIIAKMGIEGCTVTLTENEDTVALVVEGDNANAKRSYIAKMFSSHPETKARIEAMTKRCEKDGYVRPTAK